MCTPTHCPNRARSFGPDGCQVPVGNGVCGEKRTLEFINEFKRLYERKMEEIDANGGGDCMQVIFSQVFSLFVYRAWVRFTHNQISIMKCQFLREI